MIEIDLRSKNLPSFLKSYTLINNADFSIGLFSIFTERWPSGLRQRFAKPPY